METIGSRIKQARESVGLDVVPFAKLCGVTRQTIYQWQRDETKPTAENFLTISDLTGWSIRRLVRGDYKLADTTDKLDLDAIAKTPEEHTLLKDYRLADSEAQRRARSALLTPSAPGLINVPELDPESISAENDQQNLRAVEAEQQAKKKYNRRKNKETDLEENAQENKLD